MNRILAVLRAVEVEASWMLRKTTMNHKDADASRYMLGSVSHCKNLLWEGLVVIRGLWCGERSMAFRGVMQAAVAHACDEMVASELQ